MTEARPQLYGAAYSVYVRFVRLVLMEKGISYDHHEVDIFAGGGPPADYLQQHPFGRIPAFRHGSFALYESSAIARYIDEAFTGPALQPADVKARARMNQMLSIADNYLYRPLVWGLYVAQDEAAKGNAPLDGAAFEDARAKSRHCLAAIVDLCSAGPWLLGDIVSLADLHLAAMIAYGRVTVEGRAMLEEQPNLLAWWERMHARPSMTATRFAAEV